MTPADRAWLREISEITLLGINALQKKQQRSADAADVLICFLGALAESDRPNDVPPVDGQSDPGTPPAGREAAPAGVSGRRLPEACLCWCCSLGHLIPVKVCGHPCDKRLQSSKGSTPDSRCKEHPFHSVSGCPHESLNDPCDCATGSAKGSTPDSRAGECICREGGPGIYEGPRRECPVHGDQPAPAPFDPEAKTARIAYQIWDQRPASHDRSEWTSFLARIVAAALSDADRTGYERAIDEAAGVADAHVMTPSMDTRVIHTRATASSIAQRIRALKSKEGK